VGKHSVGSALCAQTPSLSSIKVSDTLRPKSNLHEIVRHSGDPSFGQPTPQQDLFIVLSSRSQLMRSVPRRTLTPR